MKPIPGFDGYLVTQDGQVMGRHGRPLAFYRDKDGYKRVTIALTRGKDADRVHIGIHQAVCLAYCGPRPAGHVARHLDGSRDNNVPGNLKWGTVLENSHDRVLHGTVPCGQRSGKAKLFDDDVYDIRCYLAAGFSQREVAKMFAVSQSTIHLIGKGETWAHVKGASWRKN